MLPSLRSTTWTLIALALLLAPGLVPVGSAQLAQPMTLCFTADPAPAVGGGSNAKACPGGNPDAPNYKQGDVVRMRVENYRREADPDPQGSPILVRCLTGCLDEQGEEEGREYWSRWNGTVQNLRFPHDFRDVGLSGKGRVALDDRAPRYNGTWEVRAFLPTGEVVRTFNVWLFSLHRAHNLTVTPGQEHVFESSGIPLDANVNFTLQRRTPVGWEALPLTGVPTRPQANGVFFYVWDVPLNETARISECPRTETHCYRAVVKVEGAGKKEETVPFRVAPADVQVRVIGGTSPDGARQAKQRTEVVSVALDLHYPGGRLFEGPELTGPELPAPPPGEQPELRVRVERTDLAGGDRPLAVGEVRLRYGMRAFMWEGSWTIPRDLEVPPSSVFRLPLPETRDRWGNRIPAQTVGNYTIAAATLDPAVTHANATLQRTDLAVVAVDVRYHNGTPVTDQDLKGPLLGCFVRDASAIPCANTTSAGVQAGAYENGVWRFTKRYARDYDRLEPHSFVLLGGSDAEDRWGNRVNRTRSEPFTVVAASPRIDFSTVMRGRAVTTLERGQDIQLLATITYGDGRPYNHTVRVNDKLEESRLLQVNLTKRGPAGDVVDVQPILLEERNAEQGLWVGALRLTLDDAQTPIGGWSFGFDVRDNLTVPNVNETRFDRAVIAAPLRYEQVRLSNPFPATNTPGANLVYSFRLRYPTGGEVDGSRVASAGLQAQVYKWDAKNATHVGQPLSNLITPQWSATDQPNVWSLRYTVPPHLFNGPYVFVIRGQDSSGNQLPGDAYSIPFTPTSTVVSRQVVTPPAPAVSRGEDATAVFAAADGDAGLDGTGKPTISVERWNDQAQRWDVAFGGTDARAASTDLVNHVGVFPVVETTPIGTYRFHLLGRDAQLNVVEAFSRNFTVEPTEVTRAVLDPPPEAATKGTTVTMKVEYLAGDRITNVSILERLRPTSLPAPQSVIQGGTLNVTWEIPVDAPSGNYTIRFTGRDQYGNLIRIDSPPIEARAAQLSGKILGNPSRIVERGAPAKMLFGITYPNGEYYASATVPKVFVRTQDGLAGTASVELRGVTYEASWSPPAHAEDEDHWFEVAGEGASGNALPLLRSASFRLAPGTFERKPVTDVPPSSERFATVQLTVPVQDDDRAVTFRADYYGTGSDTSIVQDGRRPLLTTAIPHTLDANAGTYVARWVTDHATPVGVWQLVMTGEDRAGNQVVAKSRAALLTTTGIIIQIERQTPSNEFTEGKTLEFTFSAIYKNGPIFDDAMGRPTVQMLIEGIATKQAPELEHANGRWHATWTAPDTLPPGRYTLSISGFDAYGNQMTLAKSVPYDWDASLAESFAKTIPAAPIPLTLLGLATLALLLGRARRA